MRKLRVSGNQRACRPAAVSRLSVLQRLPLVILMLCTGAACDGDRADAVGGDGVTPPVEVQHGELRRHSKVQLEDVTRRVARGPEYRRAPSPTLEVLRGLEQQPMTVDTFTKVPGLPHGLPGVALIDYDGDGDDDIYVTNGPNAPNSLLKNQLKETGALRFVDVASQAGVTATEQNSTGVCYGDIDNDGDPDLLVLGGMTENRLFENRGDGTFADVTSSSGVGGVAVQATSCAMGDVDGDGLLDLFVGNSINVDDYTGGYLLPFERNYPNQLLINRGARRFADVSRSSGILRQSGLAPENAEKPTVTWAVAMVDYDLDGDLDLLTADDQVFIMPAAFGGVDRSAIHIFNNNGTGHFTDVAGDVGTNKVGGWMGFAFGDINCDGHMDFFASNGGSQVVSLFTGQSPPFMSISSRWFVGQADGTFSDPGVGALADLPFGWGAATPDLDNDGDQDIVFYGGLATPFWVVATNPGAVLLNDGCTARFTFDPTIVDNRHARRSVHGLAQGDLDQDGRSDIVSVSSFNIPRDVPLLPTGFSLGSPFDSTAKYVPLLSPGKTPGGLEWPSYRQSAFPGGDLSIELNQTHNTNQSTAVALRGSKGLIPGGKVNRDGIGAVIRFRPHGGPAILRPVLGGASHLSQDSLVQTFGLGRAEGATLDVLWPGGARNRLYEVRASERLTLPEIPCSYDADVSFSEYSRCVTHALGGLRHSGAISKATAERLGESAFRAYTEEHRSRH